MVPKLLAWLAFASALVGSLLALGGLFGGAALGDLAPMLILWGAIPLFAVAVLIAVALLILASFG